MDIEQKLDCRLNYGRETVDAEVFLRQDNNCSIIATVVPSQEIDLIPLNADCFIESIPSSSFPRLKRTSLTISKQNPQQSSPEKIISLEANLDLAEFELQALPQDRDRVSVKMYLTNLSKPYFNNNNIKFDINIPEQQQVVLSAHTKGTISHIAEVSQIPYSELENIKNLIDSIWLR